ncbi:hypothetical protein FRC05_007920 [Tulasnella sp. 425]|nr:hypothetical protein FRC05_007920 [Tulasnella sp. 425]
MSIDLARAVELAIKYLENYLQRKHLQTLPLSALSETRLGIDATHYLRTLLEHPSTREPLLSATGGLPLALTSRIESDLRTLEKLHIKPVFVFSGLNVNKRQKTVNTIHVDACRDRKAAWDQYEGGMTSEATKLFQGRNPVIQWDLWRAVLRIFRHRNVEYMVAPYVAWAQLIYLYRHTKFYVHSIYCATDALLFPNMDRVITQLDLTAPTPTFTFVVKRSILNELGLTEEQFLDAGIMAGFDSYMTFPPNANEANFTTTVNMVKEYKMGYAAVLAHSEHPAVKVSNYLEQFARARAMVKYSLILTSEGVVTSLPLAIPPPSANHHHHSITTTDIPSDLHEVFTNKLPDEVYFYLSRGLIGPQALVWLTSGQIIEPPPLDNGETNEYKRFVKEVITEGATGPRATSLALIAGVLHNWWSKKQVTANFWFDSPNANVGKNIPHNLPATTQLVERVSGWAVPTAIIEEELRRQHSSTIDFALCLGATANDKLAARTKVKADKTKPLDKKDEVVANVIWRFLELRGSSYSGSAFRRFLMHTHTHSPFGRAMFAALEGARVNDKFQDPLYIFLELVRAGVMHGNLWSNRAYSGGPSFGSEEEKKSMLLVMRVLSILPLNFKPQQWSGPLSRELLVFNSFVRSLSRALRTLIESTALNMFLQHHARRQREDLLDISLSLPFQTDVNTGYGILIKVYLDGLVHLYGGAVVDANAEGVRQAKDEALDFCDETFNGVKDPRGEVLRGFRFWDATLATIRSLAADKSCLVELVDQFEAADRWLSPMRP